jgi:hypothetical protein
MEAKAGQMEQETLRVKRDTRIVALNTNILERYDVVEPLLPAVFAVISTYSLPEES